MTSRLSVVVAALAAAAVACGDASARDAEVDALAAQLADQDQAQTQLEERLDALEGTIGRLGTDRTAENTARHVASLDEDVSRIVDAVTVLEATIDAEAGDRRGLSDDLEAAAADLRRSVAALQGSVDEVQGEVEELRTLYTTLRDRLDRLQRGG